MTGAAQSLLVELDRQGLTLQVVAGRLRYQPVSAMTAELLQRVAASKEALLELIEVRTRARRAPLDPAFWDELPVRTASLTSRPDDRTCYACNGERWWRRAGSSTEWFCARCAPPAVGVGEIEVRDA